MTPPDDDVLFYPCLPVGLTSGLWAIAYAFHLLPADPKDDSFWWTIPWVITVMFGGVGVGFLSGYVAFRLLKKVL